MLACKTTYYTGHGCQAVLLHFSLLKLRRILGNLMMWVYLLLRRRIGHSCFVLDLLTGSELHWNCPHCIASFHMLAGSRLIVK